MIIAAQPVAIEGVGTDETLGGLIDPIKPFNGVKLVLPDTYSIEIKTYKTYKEWLPFTIYNKGDKVSYFTKIYVATESSKMENPRKYENVDESPKIKVSEPIENQSNGFLPFAIIMEKPEKFEEEWPRIEVSQPTPMEEHANGILPELQNAKSCGGWSDLLSRSLLLHLLLQRRHRPDRRCWLRHDPGRIDEGHRLHRLE